MELQIQFAVPHGQIGRILKTLRELLKEGPHMAQRDLREPGNAALHAQPHLQHLLVRTAAAVAVTVSHQDGAIDLLGLVTLPAAHYRRGTEHAVIGGPKSSIFLLGLGGGDKIGQNAAAVDSLPAEGIVGHAVEHAPADLGGDKGVDTAFNANRTGYATAQSTILFVLIASISFVLNIIMRRREARLQ